MGRYAASRAVAAIGLSPSVFRRAVSELATLATSSKRTSSARLEAAARGGESSIFITLARQQKRLVGRGGRASSLLALSRPSARNSRSAAIGLSSIEQAAHRRLL